MTERKWIVNDRAGLVDLDSLENGAWFQFTKGKEFPVYVKIETASFVSQIMEPILHRVHEEVGEKYDKFVSMADIMWPGGVTIYADIAGGKIGAVAGHLLISEVTEATIEMSFE